MSKLTFLGWLKLELARMSGSKTVNIHKLATLAQEINSRLAEPLLLYASEIDVVSRLMSYIKDDQLLEEYQLVLNICKKKSILKLSEKQREQLPWNYQKLLKSWKAAEMKQVNIDRSKHLRLQRSLQLKEEKRIPASQIYHALDLNPGNTNAYIKNHDISKVSLENATKIMKYLYSL